MATHFRGLTLTLALLLAAAGASAEEFITLASTTSTDQSGLFGFMLPKFEAKTGIKVHVVAQGTGQALDTGRRGDADALLVHDRPGEDKFMAEGWGLERRDVMYNDFVLVGPKSDSDKIKGQTDIVEAFKRLAAGSVPFISRGDRSGTNAAELRYWKAAGIDPKTWTGYKDAGAGMGPTLNMTASLGAYTVSDRGTWLSFKNKQDLEIVLAGDKRMFNPYGVIVVNPAKHANVKVDLAEKFAEWITSPEGQAVIADYKINGEQLFFPDAKP
jgi:tungstate transport system substrate-binding protein